eukprot:m51a1_g9839 hypothetical protein (174) ;mRNA; f:1940791-1941312
MSGTPPSVDRVGWGSFAAFQALALCTAALTYVAVVLRRRRAARQQTEKLQRELGAARLSVRAAPAPSPFALVVSHPHGAAAAAGVAPAQSPLAVVAPVPKAAAAAVLARPSTASSRAHSPAVVATPPCPGPGVSPATPLALLPAAAVAAAAAAGAHSASTTPAAGAHSRVDDD